MDATGLTKGGIYGNYKSKEEIALAVFDYNVEKVVDMIRVKVRQEKDAISKLKAIIQFYSGYMFDPPVNGGCPMLNTATEADDTHPGLRQKVVEALDGFKNSLIHIIKQGKENKQIKKDIDEAKFATIFISLIEGSIMLAKSYRDQKYINESLDHLLEMVEGLKTR